MKNGFMTQCPAAFSNPYPACRIIVYKITTDKGTKSRPKNRAWLRSLSRNQVAKST